MRTTSITTISESGHCSCLQSARVGRAMLILIVVGATVLARTQAGHRHLIRIGNTTSRYILKVLGKEEFMADGKPVLKEVVSKCGGLPKVIVEIANLMKRKTKLKELATYINNKFMQELKSSREFGGLPDLFYCMQCYIPNCPDFLKTCIFYLSIFSTELPIRRRRGGLQRGTQETAIKNLLSRTAPHWESIIQQPSSVDLGDTRLMSWQINGFFREYIISERLEDNHVFELDGSCTMATERTGRHFVISKSWDREKIVFKSIDFSKLRSQTVSGTWESFFVSEGMKLLRVLDLEAVTEGDVNYSDLKKIVKCFPRLKFLSLRGRSEIRRLPSSVGDLRQLQTLDIRHTSIDTLPVNITKLQSLAACSTSELAPLRRQTRRNHQHHIFCCPGCQAAVDVGYPRSSHPISLP
ncbi:LOW QUALITY PROTEIN: hypothetical protein U9M48_040178 [Paspalum notatum var. saurae]|uniref:Disease resistance R13L4/SHOC-2-like LRR domain-containing protein n=1 Tax=Paspalum notatum var. saurae TaxID=547442 RepID=A0AAQ3XFB3_PASNO